MNCGGVERWLSDGMPAAGSGRAHVHAERCPICAGRITDAQALDAFLEFAAPPAAPPGFADRVLARIAIERQVEASRLVAASPAAAAPWIRVLTDPAFTSSIAAAAALVGLWRAARLLARTLPALRIPGSFEVHSLALPHLLLPQSPLGQWMLLLGLAPLLVWGSLHLARWTEHAVHCRVRRG